MSSQGSNHFKPSQSDINLKGCSYQEILKTLDEDTLLTKKIECIHIVASKYVPIIPRKNLETEIFRYLMPTANEVLLSIFESSIELVLNSEQKCTRTLNILKEYFQMAINLLQIMEDLLDFMMINNEIDLSEIQSVPLNLSKMLYTTFLHCKESQNFYVHFDFLDEILTLFKKAQEVHVKLLKLLDFHVTFNLEFEEELALLKQVLEALVDIGRVLTGMNVKSMADSWKTYLALTQKYIEALSADFNIQQPLNFLLNEIVSSIKTVTNTEERHNNADPQLIKIANFLIKVMSKLCNMFWQNLQNFYKIIWDFLISFYSYSYTQMSFQNVPKSTIDLIKTQLFDSLDHFLTKLCDDIKFFEVSNFTNRILSGDDTFGFLVLFHVVFNKLLLSKDSRDLDNKIDVPRILQLLFITINKCYTEIFVDDNVYDTLITVASRLVLLSGNYNKFESDLYRNLLSDHIWNSLIASNIWNFILSKSSPNYKFEILLSLARQCSDVTMKVRFANMPNFIILHQFITQLYQMQSDEFKLKFIVQYPPASHMHLWRHIGFGHLPINCNVKFESLLLIVTEKMEKFDADKCTYDDFVCMCDCMQAVSTINFEDVYLDVNKLSLLIIRLWDFDATNDVLLDHNLFKLYIQSLCDLTNSLLWKWSNTELVQILQQLKLLLNKSVSVKLSILQLLNYLSSKFIENTHLAVISIASELFKVLLNDTNPIIRQYTLEIFTAHINNASHEQIIQNTVNDSNRLQEVVSNFVKKNTVNDGNCYQFLKSSEENKFHHQCVVWMEALPKTKKLKAEINEGIGVLQRIKKDVHLFCKLCERNDLRDEDVSDIHSLINQLQSYV